MLKQILDFLAVLGAYLSFTALCEHFGIGALVFPKYILDPHVGIHFGRSRGPFVDTIGNGGMLLISSLALSCISSGFSGVKRFLSFCLVLLAVPAIYFTETRAVWLGLAAILATSALLRTSVRSGAAFISAAVLIGFLSGVGSKFSISEQTLFSRRQNTVDYRLDNYQTAWNAFTKNPLFGVGYGRFHLEWSSYFNEAESRTQGLDDGNHSTPLGILAELGATGFVPFVATIVCAFIVCVAAYGRTKNDEYEFERRFVLLALGAIETFVILGLTNDLHSTPVVNATAFWLVGIVSTIGSEDGASNAARSDRALRRVTASERTIGRGLARSHLH
jgi:O-antigen ligase